MEKSSELQKIENFLKTDENIEINSKNFEKIMFIYKVAIKEIENKLDILKQEDISPKEVLQELEKTALKKYEEKETEIGIDELRELERVVVLKVVDEKWMDHIDAMDELKDGIGLRAYGQKDPVIQYQIEGADMFDEMTFTIKYDVVKLLLNIHKQKEIRRTQAAQITKASLESINSVDGEEKAHVTVVNDGPTIGRNDSCPCGSGKKYKNCCGRNQ